MLRRLLVEDKIEAGVVVNVNEEGVEAVAVELQADLEMYDDDHQRKRSINKVFRGGLIV
jgi:competence protein ComGC